MELLENIYRNILLEESVDISDIDDALDNHKRVIINYHTKGEDKNTGARVAEVYAYGLTYGGNPVIRVFQPYGDTTTRVPGWKFMRLDRISAWQTTEQTFDTPANERYPGLGDFNSFGDKTMAVVYKVAKFGNEQITNNNTPKEPKTKEDVYKTDSEKNMGRLRQQVNNPIKLSDIKVGDAFRQIGQKQAQSNQPKTKQDIYKPEDEKQPEANSQIQQKPQANNQTEINRTAQQKTPEEKEKDLDKLRNILKDKPISLSDLNKRMKEPQQTRWQDIFNDKVDSDLQQLHKNDIRNQRRRDNRWQKSADTRPLGNRKDSLNRAFEK